MAKPVEWTFRARKKCIYIYFMLISLQFDDSSYKCERKKMYGTQQTATKIENVIMSMNVSVNMYVYMLVYMFVCVYGISVSLGQPSSRSVSFHFVL